MTETTITKEQLDELWNALEYTLGTIGYGFYYSSVEGNTDYYQVNKARAYQSNAYLKRAIQIINQMREET